MGGYIGCDLDGTLAQYGKGHGVATVGAPIPKMVERVKGWLEQGHEVRIITARIRAMDLEDFLCIGYDEQQELMAWNREQRILIQDFLKKAGLPELQIQGHKCFSMLELYDDRAIQVKPNTGELVGQSTRGL